MRLLVLPLCLVGLAACTSWRVQADADCRAYGYLPQTDAYTTCLERAHVAYRERWQALVVGLAQAQAQHQAAQPVCQRPVYCTTYQVGQDLNTSCY